MAASADKKKKCQTVIPATWTRCTGPAYTRGMTAEAGRRAWYEFLRLQRDVGPTPRIYRKD